MAKKWHFEYRHEFYDTLPDYDEVEYYSPPQDFLDEAEAIFRKWKLDPFAAVSLLHKHFDVPPDQVLLREFSKENKEIIGEARDMPRDRKAIEYIWRYASFENDVKFVPVEYMYSEDELGSMPMSSEVVKSASGFHEDYYECLIKHGVERFCGVTLLPGMLFDLSGKRSLVENSDALSFVLRPQNEEDDDEAGTQTIWAFAPNEVTEGLICIAHTCISHGCGRHGCNVHCGAHCKVHCRVHCRQHVCRRHDI